MRFRFETELWRWPAPTAAWTFVSVPAEAAGEIHEVVDGLTNGFKSVRVDVRVRDTRWRTSLFPAGSDGGYVLPIKKTVRAAESLDPGDTVPVEIELVDF